MTNPSTKWEDTEQVLAGPFADLLRSACDKLTEYEVPVWAPRDAGHDALSLRNRSSDMTTVPTTSRRLWTRRYAERYDCTERTAERHFSLVLKQPTISVFIADRIAALLGEPSAFVEATGDHTDAGLACTA